MDLEYNTHQQICRTCLKIDNNLHHIFAPYRNNKLISDILMECTIVKIKKDDNLPTSICNVCLKTLNSINDFRDMVIESDAKLQNLYCIKIKKVASDSDIPHGCIIKEEESVICDDTKWLTSNDADMKEKSLILPIASAELGQNEQSDNSHTKINITEGENLEVKEETCNNINMVNTYDENSSSRSFVFFTSDKDFNLQHKKEHISDSLLCNNKNTLKVPLCKKIGKKMSEKYQHFDLSEYQHMKVTLSKEQKRHAKVLCRECKKSYGYKYFLLHIRRHMGDACHKCETCGKGFLRPDDLKHHKVIHTENRPFVCEVCNRDFKRVGGLNAHKLVHMEETPYICNVCGKQFKHKYALNTHLLRHTERAGCICELCGKTYPDRNLLSKHLVIHTTEYKHRCTECNKSFKTVAGLKSHTRMHSSVRPHTCKVCNKHFKDKAILANHSAIHSGEKPYSCKICGKTFRQYSCLPRHMRIHTGETPFYCEKCPAAFKYSHHLKNHIKTHS